MNVKNLLSALSAAAVLMLAIACGGPAATSPAPEDAETLERVRTAYTQTPTPVPPTTTPTVEVIVTDAAEFEERLGEANAEIDGSVADFKIAVNACNAGAAVAHRGDFFNDRLAELRRSIPGRLTFQETDGVSRNDLGQNQDEAMSDILRRLELLAEEYVELVEVAEALCD